MQYCFLQFTPRRDDSHRYGSKIRVGTFNNIHYLNALRIILIVCKLEEFLQGSSFVISNNNEERYN
jgi:hypothetical protein